MVAIHPELEHWDSNRTHCTFTREVHLVSQIKVVMVWSSSQDVASSGESLLNIRSCLKPPLSELTATTAASPMLSHWIAVQWERACWGIQIWHRWHQINQCLSFFSPSGNFNEVNYLQTNKSNLLDFLYVNKQLYQLNTPWILSDGKCTLEWRLALWLFKSGFWS